MSYLERKSEFYAAPPAADVLPLLLLRRSLYRWEAARAEASWIHDEARDHPADATLARCASQCGRDVEAMAGIAARAATAWAGAEQGTLAIRHREDDATRLVARADGPAGPTLTEEGPGSGWFAPGVPTLDLVAAEKDLIKQSIAGMVAEPRHRARAFEGIDRWGRVDPIGYALGSGSNPWTIAYVQVICTERMEADGRPVAS